MNNTPHYDVLIVGAGLAGLSVALSLPTHLKIALLAKSELDTAASVLAQGGIAAVLGCNDSLEQHIEDTLVAGAGLCIPSAVEQILKDAPCAIDWLIAQGVNFDLQENQQLHLTREGGHSARRIAHVADYTGKAVMQSLFKKLQQQCNVECLVGFNVVQLLHQNGACIGVEVAKPNGQLLKLCAVNTVLATGGMGQLFSVTTNPMTATGDGVSLAWQAGCRVANLEFIQFHPTALSVKNAKGFLISEALRGEGGILKDPNGLRFMPDYDARAELAPRDIVARAIADQMRKHQSVNVYLDMTHLPAEFIQTHFPAIYQQCLSFNLDICTQPIPVAPAAHYACGGVLTDANGRTDLAQLFAVGEVACTGLHGANRLASNSLLECVVVGRNVANAIANHMPWQMPMTDANEITLAFRAVAVPETALRYSLKNLQHGMSQFLGIQRNFTDMQCFYEQLLQWRQQFILAKNSVPHALYSALLMLKSALHRDESRGTHFNQDCPNANDEIGMSVIAGKIEHRTQLEPKTSFSIA